jgi:hypothetical protein
VTGEKALADPNRHYFPLSPTTPLFKAVAQMSPAFDWQSADVITDRNNLRKLLQFLSNSRDEPFTIHGDMHGSAMVFTRLDPGGYEQSFFGYGKDFERASTKGGGFESFHRVTALSLGKLQLVVRSETDACQNNDALELKTKRNDRKYEFPWCRTALQMVLGDVSKLVVAWMQFDRIEQVEELSYEGVVERGSCQHEVIALLSKLEKLLLEIKAAATQNSQKSFQVTYAGSGDTLKFQYDDVCMLPTSIKPEQKKREAPAMESGVAGPASLQRSKQYESGKRSVLSTGSAVTVGRKKRKSGLGSSVDLPNFA